MSRRPIRRRADRAAQPSPSLQQAERTRVLWQGRKLIFFGGCDYHRLSSHPRVCEALREGLEKFGLNVAASRVTTGNHPIYEELEAALARFFGVPAAVLAPGGYQSNLMVAQALASEMDHVILDDGAHSSLAEAAERFECPVLKFEHDNIEELIGIARSLGGLSQPILLTDGMFAHDGSVAPLRAYAELLPSRAWMLVDDAHGAGVIGKAGRGTLAYEGMGRSRIVQTITLSKAFGVYGGAVLCGQALANGIVKKSKLYAGATPLPLPLANAALEAVKLLENDGSFVERLERNALFVKARLFEKGWENAATPGPIVSFVPKSERQATALKRRLLDAGIFPSLIRYGNGPAGGYFRFAISSEHTQEQLEKLVEALTGF